jgi:hypothetical protein
VADRANKRIQIFSPEGDFLGLWTDMGGPNDITGGKDGPFYIAAQVGQEEGIEFLRHQLTTRHRSPEIRRAQHHIVRGCAVLAGLAVAAIAAIVVLHPMGPAGERSAPPATDIASTGATSAPNEITRGLPVKAAPMAEAAAVLPSTPPLVPTVPPAPTPQAQSDRALPARMEPTRPPEESPSPAAAQPVTIPTASPPSTEPPSDMRLSPAGIAALVARGDGFLSTGDIASARLFYERAADAGDGPAALRLGATLDPGFLNRAGIRGVQGDADQAASWYRRARKLDLRRLTEPGPPAR